MKFKLLVALALILAFVWAGAVMAAPTKPAGGDPDIWERARPNPPSTSIRTVVPQAKVMVTIDVMVFKVSVKQDTREIPKSDKSYRFAVIRRTSGR